MAFIPFTASYLLAFCEYIPCADWANSDSMSTVNIPTHKMYNISAWFRSVETQFKGRETWLDK